MYNNQFNFDNAYSELLNRMQQYRNKGDLVPEGLRPRDNRELDELDNFTAFAINELPAFYQTTDVQLFVNVLTATLSDRQLGHNNSSLALMIAGMFKFMLNKNLNFSDAFYNGFFGYAAWYAVNARWQLNLSYDEERDMQETANSFGQLINTRGRQDTGRRQDQRGNFAPRGDFDGGGFNSRRSNQINTDYGDNVRALNRDTRPPQTYQAPAVERPTAPVNVPTPPRENPVQEQQIKYLTCDTWAPKASMPHPPAWYGTVANVVIGPDGALTMTPALLALPASAKSTIYQVAASHGTADGINMSALTAMAPLRLAVREVAMPETAFTSPMDYMVKAVNTKGVVNVTLRAELWDIDIDVDIMAEPMVAIREFFHQPTINVMDQVGYLKHLRSPKADKSVALSDPYYWVVNNHASRAFRFITEVMMGIDPGTVRMGCFGPTGNPADEHDVTAFIEFVGSQYGSVYADVLTSNQFAATMAELVFSTVPEVAAAVNEVVKVAGKKLVSGAHAATRYAHVQDRSIVDELNMIKWRTIHGNPSPYGYAPSTISQAVTPALYDLATQVLETHKNYRLPIATINFAVGKLLVTKSLINGSIIGKWTTFIG